MHRRDRRKQETLDDIKACALRQLGDTGPAGISMRGIARELDMTATAVHYYFPSRAALVDALVVDGCTSFAAALRTTYDAAQQLPGDERWFVLTRARRQWALAHPAEYLLIYGNTGAAARRSSPASAHAMQQVVAVIFAGIADFYRARTTGGAEATPIAPALRAQLDAFGDGCGLDDVPAEALAACLLFYTHVHGAITLELVGQLPPQLDLDSLFELQLQQTAQGCTGSWGTGHLV